MKLPKLLAGPILRRIEQNQAFIWIATSKPYEVEAELFEIQSTAAKDGHDYRPVNIYSETKRISLGERLFGYLIKIAPIKGFFPNEVLLGYNLTFSNPSEKWDLKSLNLLSEDNPFSIVYEGLQYPTFFITNNHDRKLFGSCRKLHGKGEDALLSGDLKLRETYFDLKERPGALFLVGDQIYADDVADPIAPFIYHLAEKLIGVEENLSVIDDRLQSENLQRRLRKVRGRRSIMERFCKFTSNKSHNHLMTFGEYAAMYLLSLSPEVWDLAFEENNIQPFDNLVKNEEYYFIFPNGDEHEAEQMAGRKRYQEQLEELKQFQQAIPHVRRLLANIPTYMMLDDHDITDDLYISLEWKEDVLSSPLGRHVVANGLAGYWLFQGWGNAPDQFDHSFHEKMKNYLQSFDVQSISYQDWLETLLQFKKWSFVTPTNPKALFLDTRNQRSFTHTTKRAPIGKVFKEISAGPQLISEEGWKILSTQLNKSDWKSQSPLIIVSPSPFYGIRLIEAFLHQYVMPLRMLQLPVQTKFDLEAWKFNGGGYYEFHSQISKWNPSSCIILSGDAHMGSAVETTLSFRGGHSRRLQQFTSSPLKNESFHTLTELFLKGLLRIYTWTSGKAELHRICDDSYQLSYTKGAMNEEESCLWKEMIHYLSLPGGSIIDTDNHLAQLSIDGDEAKVDLLKSRNFKLEEKNFDG